MGSLFPATLGIDSTPTARTLLLTWGSMGGKKFSADFWEWRFTSCNNVTVEHISVVFDIFLHSNKFPIYTVGVIWEKQDTTQKRQWGDNLKLKLPSDFRKVILSMYNARYVNPTGRSQGFLPQHPAIRHLERVILTGAGSWQQSGPVDHPEEKKRKLRNRTTSMATPCCQAIRFPSFAPLQ